MSSIRSDIRGFKEKMFLEEIAIRMLKNRNNPSIIEVRKKLNPNTKYEATKKAYQTIFK
jgi:DeoR/GlpR family transcriptional regulator of sugar metabolism